MTFIFLAHPRVAQACSSSNASLDSHVTEVKAPAGFHCAGFSAEVAINMHWLGPRTVTMGPADTTGSETQKCSRRTAAPLKFACDSVCSGSIGQVNNNYALCFCSPRRPWISRHIANASTATTLPRS